MALVPLSQDHHHGLMLVLKIKKGIRYGVAPRRMSAYLMHEFQEALVPHFRDEEEGVFRWLSETDPVLVRALEEHRRMETLVENIRERGENLSLLQMFIEVLEAHIRFEERVLFPLVQEQFPDRLNDMASDVPAAASCHSDAGWPDHFWLPPTP